MTAKSTKKVLSTVTLQKRQASFDEIIRYVLLFMADVLVLFNTRIPLNFFRWLTMIVVRVFLIYQFGDKLMIWFPMNRAETFSSFLYDFLIVIPIIVFSLYYFFSTLVMFLAPFYSGSNAFSGNGEYTEINRFLDWRNNKMKFSSYGDSAQLMRDSAILNNLDQNDPNARKTLDYINNQMRFMSYSESLNFLRGQK